MYKRNIEARSSNHCCRWQAISITYYKCVPVAFVIQHAMLMRRITLSSVASMPLQHLPTLSHKRHDFRTNVAEHKMCVLIFSSIYFGNIFSFLWRIQRRIIKIHSYSHKVPRYTCHILMKLELYPQIFEKFSNIKFLENRYHRTRLVPCVRTEDR